MRHCSVARALLGVALLLAGLTALSAVSASPALAQGDAYAAARRAYDLSSELMSPFCPGRTLQDCPSPDAAALREQIRGWIDAGLDDGEIRARVEAGFGDAVVGVPRSAWGWATPIAILLVGLALLALALRRAITAHPVPEEPLDPELERALQDQLDS